MNIRDIAKVQMLQLLLLLLLLLTMALLQLQLAGMEILTPMLMRMRIGVRGLWFCRPETLCWTKIEMERKWKRTSLWS
jgi:hypothetical protein